MNQQSMFNSPHVVPSNPELTATTMLLYTERFLFPKLTTPRPALSLHISVCPSMSGLLRH